MTADYSYSLEALERRWELEKTPQVGLRLAEEYRHKGNLDRSVETLVEGLEAYPNHTSSRVALCRYLMDGARFPEALPHLERIVAGDPAHLVANKLLVRAYAGVGRLEEARDKLAIYEMMGEGDADIDDLRALVEAPREVALASPDSVTAFTQADGDAGADARPEPAFAEPAFESAEDRLAGPGDPAEVPKADPRPGTRGAAFATEMPFAEPEPLEGREDLFEVDASAPSGDEVESHGEMAEEPFGAAFEAIAASSDWQGVADEGIFVMEPREAAPAKPQGAVVFEQLQAALIPDDRSDRDDRKQAAAADSGVSSLADPFDRVAGPAGTVTLGKLYREQGYREEAAELFEEVLSREPTNEVARRELAATRKAEAGAPAPEMLSTQPVEGDSSSGPADRRRAALTAYRARLRRAIAAGI